MENSSLHFSSVTEPGYGNRERKERERISRKCIIKRDLKLSWQTERGKIELFIKPIILMCISVFYHFYEHMHCKSYH